MRYLALVGFTVLLILLIACGGTGDPNPGDPCTPGSRYTHVNDTRRVSLYCGEDGTWRKA